MQRYRFLTRLLRYGVFPLMFLGFNGVLVALVGRGAPLWQPFSVLLLAIGFMFIADLGVSAAHHASPNWSPLWRFHAVHHSVKRMYGFSGPMKHPVHQMVEGVSGFAPLLVLGIDVVGPPRGRAPLRVGDACALNRAGHSGRVRLSTRVPRTAATALSKVVRAPRGRGRT